MNNLGTFRQQITNNPDLFFFVGQGFFTPRDMRDWQILKLPVAVFAVVIFRIAQGKHMPVTPSDIVAVAATEISVAPFNIDTQGGGNGSGHFGFFCNIKSGHLYSSIHIGFTTSRIYSLRTMP